MRTIAGDCTVRFDGQRERVQRGRVLVIVKPDDTVLVHDTDGYQPVAWLTRPESLSLTRDPLWLVAVDGDQTLRLTANGEVTVREYESTAAGTPVGDCRCGGSLVRTRGSVVCLDCDGNYGLPSGATILDDAVCECGLPRMAVERGDRFELCIDRRCEPLADVVRERFDRTWPCPEPGCDGTLRIIDRGGLVAGCEHYPDCEAGFAVPDGVVAGDCACGLPRFETPTGGRCLDGTCGRV